MLHVYNHYHLIYNLYMFFHSMRKSVPLSILFVIIAIYLFSVNIEFDVDTVGRFADMSYSSSRESLNNNSVSFLSTNLLIGGIAYYRHLFYIPPHNDPPYPDPSCPLPSWRYMFL